MKRASNTAVYLIAFLLLGLGAGYLVWSGLTQGSVYFLNVEEALAAPADSLQSARLFGTVCPNDLVRAEDSLGVNFWLADKDNQNLTLRVEYAGVVPDTFQQGSEVIVEGRMVAADTFRATTLMTKCPSKYEKKNRDPKL